MAHNLDDPEFWLPHLLDDSVISDFEKTRFFSSESNSGFSSPVDSVLDSTEETESDEDEFLAELTRRLTNSTHLSHDIWKRKPNHSLLLPCDKTDTLLWKMPTSPPQSTLCNEEVEFPNKPFPISFFSDTKNEPRPGSATDHAYQHLNQGIIYHAQPNAKKQNGYVRKMQQSEVNGLRNSDSMGRTLGLLSPSAWPTLQQSQSHKQPLPGSWTRSVILGNNTNIVNKRQCSGTGVFLPRPTPNETRRKKPVAMKQRNNAVVLAQAQQRRDIFLLPASVNNEIRLPREWTYEFEQVF